MLGGVIASIWAVGLVASGKVSLPAGNAAPQEVEKIGEEIDPLQMSGANMAKIWHREAKKMRKWVVQAQELLDAWIKATQEGNLYYQTTGGEFKLSDDHIAYIKSWTDHDLTREIAEEVLTGRYRPRLKE